MATYGRTARRGLPRQPGGDAWPPARAAPVEVVLSPAVTEVAVTEEATSGHPAAAVIAADPGRAGGGAIQPASPAAVGGAIRRGLPRIAGGQPWPHAPLAPSGSHDRAVLGVTPGNEPVQTVETTTDLVTGAVVTASPTPLVGGAFEIRDAASTAPATPESASLDIAMGPSSGAQPLRRGLPRVVGGEPWPPAGFMPGALAEAAETAAPAPLSRRDGSAQPLSPAQTPEPKRIGPFTRLQWAGAAIVGGAGLLLLAGLVVVAARFLLSLEPLQEFLVAYPGEYPLPEGAPVGIPPWLGWQHFFNVFLMALIIRSGFQVRTEKRPTVFWSPRGNAKRKISLNVWFHQALDILWIVNGLTFVVLLFITGQWMKLVPTSWAVFPNAISAALQYGSLNWPTENGWVNYNSLQQLAYFTTVFIAAPLAIATGVRMSGIWPKDATTLNRLYPVEWARAIHFPVMLYFVAFIIAHVALVLATGALRNLNHMYASQDAVNWVGFWVFVASLVVIAAGWVAARPLVLAPIARLFGKVGRG